ncbi:MAG: Lysine--tRNA ligase, partial [Candidatus Berkelbacteria bacterium Licking1014_2]
MPSTWLKEVITSVKNRPASKNKKRWLVTDWWTPSGRFHLGNLRSFLLHSLCAQELNKIKPTNFSYGIEDYDPFDGRPAGMPRSWEKYLGLPLCQTPSPDKKLANFAEYAVNDVRQIAERLKIKVDFPRTSAWYRQGKLNEAIKSAINKASVVRKIYQDIANKKQPCDWLPIQMICQECGKIGTTRAYHWDGEKIHYICEKNWVKYTAGCGHKGAASPLDGKAKLPWKVEWPALWHTSDSDLEGSGKEHHTKGGSHDMGVAIIQQVFGAEPPADFSYEFFLLKGQKMSSSAGRGFWATDLLTVLPPEVIFHAITNFNPGRQINVDLYGETIPNFYDNFDRAAPGYHCRFAKIAYLLQMPRADIFAVAEQEKGRLLTTKEKGEIKQRKLFAQNWLARYAPEKFKLAVTKEMPKGLNLSAEQKKFLNELAKLYQSKESWTGEDLHQEIHRLKSELHISPKAAFGAIYQLF